MGSTPDKLICSGSPTSVFPCRGRGSDILPIGLCLVHHLFHQLFWSLTHSSSWKMIPYTALILAYPWVFESRLEYLFILGKQSLRGTLKHYLQISEGLSQGRRIRFVCWHPQGNADTRIVVVPEAAMMVIFLDAAGTVVGMLFALPCSFLEKSTFRLNIRKKFLVH